MRRVGKRLPDFFRRVAQFSDENERPLLSVLSYLRPAGRTRCVLLAIVHLLLLVFLFLSVDSSMWSRRRCAPPGTISGTGSPARRRPASARRLAHHCGELCLCPVVY